MNGHLLLRYLTPLIAVALFGTALWVLHQQLAGHRWTEIVAELRAIPVTVELTALGLAALSYVGLTAYDVLAVRYVGRSLPYPKVALASFSAYTFSHNLGFALLTGGSVRYRLYSVWGLSAGEVAEVVAFGSFTFILGLLALGGLGLAVAPGIFAPLGVPTPALRALGVVCLAVVAGYVVLCALRRAPLIVGGWRIPFPSLRLALGQIAVASLDWLLAASVLHVLLLTAADVSYATSVGIFLLAAGAGFISHVPGGLGVFETVVLLLIPEPVSVAAVLGALVAYRVIYYLVPLAVAAALLAGHEIWLAREGLGRVTGTFGRWAVPMVPHVLAAGVFLAGAVMLFSGATPTAIVRLRWLDYVLPLTVIEVSHFLASLTGAGLLLLARGLQRRVDAAYHLTLVLLTAGIFLSLLKGFAYETALILGVMLAALWPCRPAFYRHASLIGQRFTPGWIAAIAIVLLAAAWLGLFSHQHVAYREDLWWRFALYSDAPRFLRALTGVVVLLLAVALLKLLRPAPAEPARPTAEEIERAAAIAAASTDTTAHLALLGDKALLFSSSGRGFLMYGVQGRSWVSMGDPVGPADDRLELAWRFREMSDRHGGWTVFYRVQEAHLPLYLDLGLSLLKLGEEARVPLNTFSLEDRECNELRQGHARLGHDGFTFDLQPPGAVPQLLPDLREVSDAWLRERKHVREKGFSVGSFRPDYLARSPVALVRRAGRIVAFANVWLGAEKEELSVDLIRYRPDVPRAVLDFLFVELMRWGRTEGYRWFNLGMAPLPGHEDRALAPAWARLSAFIFRHGEHFQTFQELRRYKETFDPVWRPRYLASPAGFVLPRIVADTAALIAGGYRGVVGR